MSTSAFTKPAGMPWNEVLLVCDELSEERFLAEHPGPFLVQVPEDLELPPFDPLQVELRLACLMRAVTPTSAVHSLQLEKKGERFSIPYGRDHRVQKVGRAESHDCGRDRLCPLDLSRRIERGGFLRLEERASR